MAEDVPAWFESVYSNCLGEGRCFAAGLFDANTGECFTAGSYENGVEEYHLVYQDETYDKEVSNEDGTGTEIKNINDIEQILSVFDPDVDLTSIGLWLSKKKYRFANKQEVEFPYGSEMCLVEAATFVLDKVVCTICKYNGYICVGLSDTSTTAKNAGLDIIGRYITYIGQPSEE